MIGSGNIMVKNLVVIYMDLEVLTSTLATACA
ncbi:MAG: hypothetical protein JWP13_965 [Candidatus Saccharibacteria bacterium]|nr:hypothetical protein [Candidatus Saccharibacteria bacterium]